MGGIVFFQTKMLDNLSEFYTKRLGMKIWLEQPGCTIFHHGNLLIGFCQRDTVEREGMITFVYDTKEEVDSIFAQLSDIAEGKPIENEKYRIYQFFARDPEGRALEFQVFLHQTQPI